MLSAETFMTRRAVITTVAVGAGTAMVAACGSNQSHAPRTTLVTTTSAGGPRGAVLAALANIPVGEAIAVTLPNGRPGFVARPTPDTAAAFSAICTHLGCTVNAAGKQLHCPCHFSVYDAASGAVISGPAPRPLDKIPVQLVNGQVITTAAPPTCGTPPPSTRTPLPAASPTC